MLPVTLHYRVAYPLPTKEEDLDLILVSGPFYYIFFYTLMDMKGAVIFNSTLAMH